MHRHITGFAPSPPARVPAAHFGPLLAHIAELDQALPSVAEEDRQPHGGYLFAEGPAIVAHLVRAMRQQPEHFGEFPDPAVLESRQDRAGGWLWLQRNLQALADRAGALHQIEQSAVTRDALAILRKVREAARGDFPSRADQQRRFALDLPLALLNLWQRRLTNRLPRR